MISKIELRRAKIHKMSDFAKFNHLYGSAEC